MGVHDVGENSHLMRATKKAISRALDLGLEKALWYWKANTRMYKVMFHESLLILMYIRSKEPSFTSSPNVPLP